MNEQRPILLGRGVGECMVERACSDSPFRPRPAMCETAIHRPGKHDQRGHCLDDGWTSIQEIMQCGPLGSGLGNGPWRGRWIVPEMLHRQGNNAIVLVLGQCTNHCFDKISTSSIVAPVQGGTESSFADRMGPSRWCFRTSRYSGFNILKRVTPSASFQPSRTPTGTDSCFLSP